MPPLLSREVKREPGEHTPLPALRCRVEVSEAKDHAMVGQAGTDRGDRELGSPHQPLDAALAVPLSRGVLTHRTQFARGLDDSLGLK